MTDGSTYPITAGEAAVGDAGPTVVVEDLSREDFVRYAGASGDFNRIHYDEPYVTAAGHDGPFAQGMLTAGFAARLAADWFGLANVTTFEVRFRSRVWPGDTVTVRGEIVDVTGTDDGSATVEATLAATSQDDEDVLTGRVTAALPPDE